MTKDFLYYNDPKKELCDLLIVRFFARNHTGKYDEFKVDGIRQALLDIESDSDI